MASLVWSAVGWQHTGQCGGSGLFWGGSVGRQYYSQNGGNTWVAMNCIWTQFGMAGMAFVVCHAVGWQHTDTGECLVGLQFGRLATYRPVWWEWIVLRWLGESRGTADHGTRMLDSEFGSVLGNQATNVRKHPSNVLLQSWPIERVRKGTDFIREKIFPGGHLPCLAEIRRACRVGRTELSSTVTYCNSWFQDSKWEAENVASHLREDSFRTSLRECSAPFSLGQSYAETLNEWRRRFELHETQSFCWQVGLVVVVGLDSCWVSENGFWSSFAALLFLFVTKIMFHLEKDGKGMSWNVLNMSKTSYTNSLLRRFHFRTWFFCTSLVAVLWSSLLLWLSNWRPGSLMYNHCRIIYIERDTYLSTPNMRIQ